MLWQEKPYQSWEMRLFCIWLWLDWKPWYPCKVASLSAPSDWSHPVVCSSMTATNCMTMPLQWVWPAFSLCCDWLGHSILTVVYLNIVHCIVLFCSVTLYSELKRKLDFLKCRITLKLKVHRYCSEFEHLTKKIVLNNSHGHTYWLVLFATHEALRLNTPVC